MSLRLYPFFVALLAFGLALNSPSAYGQRVDGAAGLGGQFGDPSGVTLKIYNVGDPSYDFLAAWDLDEFFFFNAHALFESAIEAENIDPTFEWFVGPGAFIGFVQNADEAVIGLSGSLGLNFVFNQRVEVYGQVTPRLSLIPDTEEGRVQGGVGVRYYF